MFFLITVNAGYVYRTQCLGTDGRVHTSWSYDAFNDIVPYVGNSAAGCNIHAAGRLALSKVGLWPLHDAALAAAPPMMTPSDVNKAYAKTLFRAVILEAGVLKQERATLSLGHPKAAEITRANALARKFEDIRSGLAQVQTAETAVSDTDLRKMSALLRKDLSINIRASDDYVLYLSGDKRQGGTRITADNAAHLRIGRELEPLFKRLANRYPYNPYK